METRSSHLSDAHDVVIVGGGVAGSALATILARERISVAVLERDLAPVDRVRGEFTMPWGVAELKRLDLLGPLCAAGGFFVGRQVPYDENMPGDAALPFTLDVTAVHPEVPGAFCMGHPAMCAALAAEAEAAGAAYLRGVEGIANEDHWTENPTARGVVLVGDAAGHNDPITGQGLSIALRDVRLVSEPILAGRRDLDSFQPYVEERLERMRRLRIAARLAATLRAEFGEEARLRRQRAGRRIRTDKMLSPIPAVLVGPERLPAAAFEQRTIDALVAP